MQLLAMHLPSSAAIWGREAFAGKALTHLVPAAASSLYPSPSSKQPGHGSRRVCLFGRHNPMKEQVLRVLGTGSRFAAKQGLVAFPVLLINRCFNSAQFP